MPIIECKPHVEGVTNLKKQLEKWLANAEQEFLAGAAEVKKVLQAEPTPQYIPWNPVGGAPPAYASEKQHYFVRKSIQEGTMSSPYERTGELAKSWVMNETKTPNQITVTISTAIPSAKWIYERATKVYRAQKVGWPTTEDVAEKDWPKIAKKVETAINSYKP